ncbi:F0F1 ATP synthase subunit A [Klenkia taihuensis]|uniref:ATP synthase subunit a n=1 Tax=Klenkia taihuensis TaxID=1225127 RepID=A0A1I1KNG9_9ACTN|nr:F0F1 ATP synthase subunit A [Klenkia taihuensis]GHE10351.1 ATP synthase subunit a [Klenkia taihuensis]SFC59010.1 ATP synthase F0 subcomplex A subunit [Klenkia taihuensis]
MTSSASALASVLAVESDPGGGFVSPTIAEFYPPALAEFSIFGIDFTITRITVISWIATAAILAFLVLASRRMTVVPRKSQFLLEGSYSLVRDNIGRDVIGPKYKQFVPFLGALFFFIIANNAMSIVPFFQISPMSKFAYPLVLAILVYILYNAVSIKNKGLGGYLKEVAVPSGVPIPFLVLVTPIELLQVFVIRPFTLAVRLFANMFAGHMLLVVFSLGTVYLLGKIGENFSFVFAPFSFLMALFMTFFEVLVIVLQAYVFTVLTATYLNGAVEKAH